MWNIYLENGGIKVGEANGKTSLIAICHFIKDNPQYKRSALFARKA
jgi:hypothetical protein